MKIQSFATTALVVAGALALAQGASAQQINAAGATFPYPIYGKWFQEFGKANGDVKINYQSIGSGGGIQQLLAGTVDFGASDRPMKDEEIAKAEADRKFKPLHFPTVLGAVAITYNIKGVSSDLKFTPEALAGIFLGTIKKWNDPVIAKANAGVNLPGDDIVVVHRSDGSGTTFVFTDYLSKVSADWKAKVGSDQSPKWPTGLGAKGSEGVSGLVQQTPGSIGYVELSYAIQNKMAYGSVKNAAGTFVKATLESVTEAANTTAKEMPADFRVSITNAPGKNAYPISTFTWLLIPDKIADAGKKKTITEFLKWMLTKGQPMAAGLTYAPLPKSVIDKEMKAIALIQ